MAATDTHLQSGTHVAGPVCLARLDWLLLALVLALAIFFRFYQMGHVPPGLDFDEAFESLEARRILIEPGYHPIFFPGNNGVPPLKIYLTVLAFLVGGESALAIRYVSAVVGVLTVLALYLLVRALFPLPTASVMTSTAQVPSRLVRRFLPFTASLILAVLPWHTAFSRHGIEVILLPLWAVLAILFLWQGLRTSRWWHFALSGFFWGSAFYAYQAAWFLPGVLVLFLVYKMVQERGFLRRYAGHLLVLGLVAILVVLPLALFVYHNPTTFAARSAQVGVFARGEGSEAPLFSLAHNALKVAGLFAFGGDVSITDNIYKQPPMPLALALALLVGLGVALCRIKRAEYGLLLIWFTWMLLPSILTDNAPSIRRAIGSVAPMVILIALGMGWLFDWVGNWARMRPVWHKPARIAAALAIGALALYTAAWSYEYYFVRFPQGKDLFQHLDVGLNELGKYAEATPTDTRLYYTPVVPPNVLHLPVTWQLRDRDLRTFDGKQGLVLAPSGPRPSLYLITVYRGDTWTLPALQTFYPAGRVAYSISNPYGVLHSLAFAVDPNSAPMLDVQNPTSARFEDGIELLGSSLSAPEIRAGETLTVTLYWRATAGPTQLSHTVFTHLLGPPKAPDGSIVWAGHDGPPLGDTYPTVRWDQGEIIVDRHVFTVPPDAPAGTYQIETGLYTPQQGGIRLKLLDAAGQPQGDHVMTGTVVVR